MYGLDLCWKGTINGFRKVLLGIDSLIATKRFADVHHRDDSHGHLFTAVKELVARILGIGVVLFLIIIAGITGAHCRFGWQYSLTISSWGHICLSSVCLILGEKQPLQRMFTLLSFPTFLLNQNATYNHFLFYLMQFITMKKLFSNKLSFKYLTINHGMRLLYICNLTWKTTLTINHNIIYIRPLTDTWIITQHDYDQDLYV